MIARWEKLVIFFAAIFVLAALVMHFLPNDGKNSPTIGAIDITKDIEAIMKSKDITPKDITDKIKEIMRDKYSPKDTGRGGGLAGTGTGTGIGTSPTTSGGVVTTARGVTTTATSTTTTITTSSTTASSTTTTSQPSLPTYFIGSNFNCIVQTAGYKCRFDYDTNFQGQVLSAFSLAYRGLVLLTSNSTLNTTAVPTGTTTGIFNCTLIGGGKYNVTWYVFDASDTSYVTPLNSSSFSQLPYITVIC
jgi:hypothetical protein